MKLPARRAMPTKRAILWRALTVSGHYRNIQSVTIMPTPNPKGRPRTHASNAEKQRAYRQRKRAEETPPEPNEAGEMIARLHATMKSAIATNPKSNALARDEIGETPAETLENLIAYFNRRIKWK